jgi:hypothetical protein
MIAACGPTTAPEPRAPRPTEPAAVKQTITLPGGGYAHVLTMPIDEFDSARCLVVTTQTGNVSVSCTEPRIDLTPDD